MHDISIYFRYKKVSNAFVSFDDPLPAIMGSLLCCFCEFILCKQKIQRWSIIVSPSFQELPWNDLFIEKGWWLFLNFSNLFMLMNKVCWNAYVPQWCSDKLKYSIPHIQIVQYHVCVLNFVLVHPIHIMKYTTTSNLIPQTFLLLSHLETRLQKISEYCTASWWITTFLPVGY